MTTQKFQEKDFIDLMFLFWKAKKTLYIFILISLVLSSLTYKLADIKYYVSIPYKINLFSTKIKYLCPNSECFTRNTNYEFKETIKTKISSVVFNENISFIINNPDNEKKYLKILEDANNIYTNEIYKSEFFELEFLENEKNIINQTITDAKFSDRYLMIKRNIFLIDKGVKVYEFNDISIKEISNRNKIILILNIFIFISFIIFILTREIIKEKELK